ncbi:MAG TPA: hypothetical protein VEK07_08425 [Polyangiaceae bacterium]|nr:hypothetical protein [Polyangiaceae bacterium]
MSEKPAAKIALSDLATLETLIDQVPTQRPTEVSKRRAIGILAPKLYELRSKGYAWKQIASWLTEHGVAISVPAMQRYLRGVPAGPAKAMAVGRKGDRTALRDGTATPGGRAAAPSADTAVGLSAREPMVAKPAAPSSSDTSGRNAKPPPVPGTFHIRPDTRDL